MVQYHTLHAPLFLSNISRKMASKLQAEAEAEARNTDEKS
jgi:hypothetical protein